MSLGGHPQRVHVLARRSRGSGDPARTPTRDDGGRSRWKGMCALGRQLPAQNPVPAKHLVECGQNQGISPEAPLKRVLVLRVSPQTTVRERPLKGELQEAQRGLWPGVGVGERGRGDTRLGEAPSLPPGSRLARD